MSERLLTVAHVAEQLAVSEHTVLSWIRDGELRAVNVGRRPGARKPRWRIKQTDLDGFLLRRSAQSTAKPVQRRRRKTTDVIKFF